MPVLRTGGRAALHESPIRLFTRPLPPRPYCSPARIVSINRIQCFSMISYAAARSMGAAPISGPKTILRGSAYENTGQSWKAVFFDFCEALK